MRPGEAQRHRRLTELFSRAATLDAAARDAFLRALQGDDGALRPDLEALLALDEGGDESADGPAVPGLDLE